MSYASHLQGLGCAATYDKDAVMNLCPEDGRPVQLIMDLERLRKERGQLGWYQPSRPSMWRFGGLLALDWDSPDDRRWIVSLGEGHTPMLDLSSGALARSMGIELQLKQEGWPQSGFGANPTESFKDRGMSMVVSMARRLGLTRLAVPTQGNAGDSLAEYALAAGLEVVVVMPDDTPGPILRRVAGMAEQHPRVSLELVSGTIREAGQRVEERWVPRGYFSVATFREPGWRIEGKKTLGLEIAEPGTCGHAWRLPDVIVYPTGGGTGMLGMWKAFEELESLGLIGADRPRMITVQSEATSPLVHAFDQSLDDTRAVDAGQTMAVGLNVPGGVGHFRVLEIIKRSGGGALAVSEKAMVATMRRYYRDRDWQLCPEGAATLAVLPELRDRELIRSSDRVVVVNTGSLGKYVSDPREWLAR